MSGEEELEGRSFRDVSSVRHQQLLPRAEIVQ